MLRFDSPADAFEWLSERTAVLAIPEAQVTKVLLGASEGILRMRGGGTVHTTRGGVEIPAGAGSPFDVTAVAVVMLLMMVLLMTWLH